MRFQQPMQGNVMPGTAAYPHIENPAVATSPDVRILGFLGRALSLEFSSGQHYLAQAALAKARQEMAYAEAFIQLANEEFQHANMITDRLVTLGAVPAGSVLSPATPSGSVAEALRSCEVREIALTQLYAEAANYSLNREATEDHAFFNQLMEEEQAQLLKITEWLQAHYYSLSAQAVQPQTMQPQMMRNFV